MNTHNVAILVSALVSKVTNAPSHNHGRLGGFRTTPTPSDALHGEMTFKGATIRVALRLVQICRSACAIGEASAPVASKRSTFQRVVLPDATATLLFLEALGVINTTAAIFATWQEGLVAISFHVHESLEDCVFGNDLVVVQGLIQQVGVEVGTCIQDSFSP